MFESLGTSSTSSLGKNMLCGVVLLALIGGISTGSYLIYLSSVDEHTEEVLELDSEIAFWNNKTYPVFSELNFTVATDSATVDMSVQSTSDWPAESDELDSYFGVKHHLNADLFSSSALEQEPFADNPKEYELLGTATLTVDSALSIEVANITVLKKSRQHLNQKMCNMHRIGCWDIDSQLCYYHYKLVSLCVLFDEQLMTVPQDYQTGCGTGSMEKFEKFKWEDCSTEPTYSGQVEFDVRSVYDPYVIATAEDLKELAPTSTQYLAGGIALVIGCVLLLSVPLVFFCRKTNNGLLYRSSVHV